MVTKTLKPTHSSRKSTQIFSSLFILSLTVICYLPIMWRSTMKMENKNFLRYCVLKF